MAYIDQAVPTRHEKLSNIAGVKSFLGREFLTWLWFTAESNEGPMSLGTTYEKSSPYEVEIWIDDRVVLESSTAKVHKNSLKGGNPSQSEEATIALRSGKSIKEMKIGLNITGLGEFHTTLNCDDLSPRSLKLPKLTDPAETPDNNTNGTLYIRLLQTEALLSVLDGLFQRFIDARTSDSWETDGIGNIKKWISSRNLVSANTVH